MKPRGSGVPVAVSLDLETCRELAREAKRQERSYSWLMREAWRLAKAELRAMPGHAPREPHGCKCEPPLAAPDGTCSLCGGRP